MALVAEDDILPLYLIREVSLAGALQTAEVRTVFIPLLRAVASGITSFTQRILLESIPQASGKTLLAMLNEKRTGREQEVLTLLISGSDNHQISEMYLSHGCGIIKTIQDFCKSGGKHPFVVKQPVMETLT